MPNCGASDSTQARRLTPPAWVAAAAIACPVNGGIVDADLGGHVIKQRVARPRQGRSCGYRTLVAYRSETRAVFLFGFAKNEPENIDDDELKNLQKAAAEMLGWDDKGCRTGRGRQMDRGGVR